MPAASPNALRVSAARSRRTSSAGDACASTYSLIRSEMISVIGVTIGHRRGRPLPRSVERHPEAGRSHARDQALDPLVVRAEGVLAEHGALRLVVQLEVHPVDREVAPLLLRVLDELAAQPRARGLR